MKYVSAEPSPADHRQTEITRQSSSSWYSLVIVKKTHQSSGDSADFRPRSTVMIQLSHCHHHLQTHIHTYIIHTQRSVPITRPYWTASISCS